MFIVKKKLMKLLFPFNLGSRSHRLTLAGI